ncbi:polysaccharide deacetylase family protein [Cylindrospermopsis raciborskii]|uniref:polysaccharide deacetylase family protein n=1 Tax=Cylindrospermopsis raciborskii TaxID=77022 RepID=UPI0008DE7F63|nr:polysaccharide deacetylase family protein [Cylindrospermopsis raciborskii]NLQ05476.1 polysaccharide deacetylase family protein [Cylindrospermopsis raciborskii MVCC19]OHY31485.1 polysaccharide deacetylase [Cylindrospermopsis raciborskii MVCC14]
MTSRLPKLPHPTLFLVTALPVVIVALSFSWYQRSKSFQEAKSTSTPIVSTTQSPEDLLSQGFLSLQKYCESPPSNAILTSPSENIQVTPHCPNWVPGEKVLETSFQKLEATVPEKKSPEWLQFPGNANNTPPPKLQSVTPFPELNRQARLARVPIFMYHDILPQKQVFFDVTPEELEAHFQQLQKEGVTPVSPDWLLAHLRTGVPLPAKPVLLSFDDGYGGHYEYVYPLLKKYNFPAIFSVYVKKMEGKTARSSLTWEQLQEMASSPLVTIASHSVNHPRDLRQLSEQELSSEVIDSKRILQERLGIPINYFTYPEGKLDERVRARVIAAGYQMAFSMDDTDEKFVGDSPDLFTIGRFGQSRLREIAPLAWGGYPAPVDPTNFNFNVDIEKREYKVNNTELILISGGIPGTFHADSRYQLPDMLKDTQVIAAVDGGFFSLKYLDSNTMIGPVLSGNRGFIPGNASENLKLRDRPLVLINPHSVSFIPFVPESHNTLEGLQATSPENKGVTDAFVGAAWLVRNNTPQPATNFGNLYGYDIARHRAFWGINLAGMPVIGVTKTPVDSVSLGEILHSLGFRDAVMLDSGASTSLSYQGKSLVGYTPRPVPHAVVLVAPQNPQPIPTQSPNNPK